MLPFFLETLVFISYIIQSSSLSFTLRPNPMSYDITSETISSIIQYIPYHLPTFELCFGTPQSQCLQLGISITSPYSIIEDMYTWEKHFRHQFKHINSQSYETNRTKTSVGFNLFGINPYFMSGSVALDYIHLPNQSILPEKLCFVTVKSRRIMKDINLDGYLGLKRNHYEMYKLISTSFINNLFENKQIKHKSFALTYDNDGGGSIVFEKHSLSNSYCDSNEEYNKERNWYCNLNKVSIGNNEFSIKNSRVEFDSISNYIAIPFEDGEQIINHIISLSEGKCYLKNDDVYYILLCSSTLNVALIPSLHLTLNKLHFIIDWKDILKITLVEDVIVYASLLFLQKIYYDGKQNVWTIGIPGFIDKTIVFDKDNMRIGLLTNNCPNENISKRMIIIISGILCIGVILTLITKTMMIKQTNEQIRIKD